MRRRRIVTTFNEGFVPRASTADAFLPNRLRESLGLLHNDRRLARDAYALSLLVRVAARIEAASSPAAIPKAIRFRRADCCS